MTPRVIIHSNGMVSVDAEQEKPTQASIDFVKKSELFRELVAVVGRVSANETIKRGAPVLPAESVATASDLIRR